MEDFTCDQGCQDEWELIILEDYEELEEEEGYEYTYYSVYYAEDEDGREVVVLSPYEQGYGGDGGWGDESNSWDDEWIEELFLDEGDQEEGELGEVLEAEDGKRVVINIFF